MNKNKCEVVEVIKTKDGEKLLLQYIPEAGDPKYDDLPSELLKPGKVYYVKFTPIEKEQDEEFNKKQLKL